MADETQSLPSSSYDELTKILRAYSHAKGPAGLKEIAAHAATGDTVVSGNNRFLLSLGLIEGGNKKAITPLGRSLATALEYQVVADIQRYWREAVNESDFMQKVLSAVRVRGGMEPSALESHVAYTAGQSKKPRRATGARTVIEILRAAGLLSEENGRLVASSRSEPSSFDETARDVSIPDVKSRGAVIRVASDPVAVEIRINVDCSPEDLDTLGPRLRGLLEDLRGELPQAEA